MFVLSAHAVSVTCLAWFSEDRPFAVGYSDGKLLLGTKEPTEKGGVILIDAHKVELVLNYCRIFVGETCLSCSLY